MAFLTACEDTPSDLSGEFQAQPVHWSTAQVIEHLPGTWVRVDERETSVVKKYLVLDTNGDFSETTLISLDSGQTQTHRHKGTWLFDGVNLKRKYDWIDGRAPSRMNLPFVTFEIHFQSKNDFEGIDHIHHNQIHYVRESSAQNLDQAKTPTRFRHLPLKTQVFFLQCALAYEAQHPRHPGLALLPQSSWPHQS